jgi:plastocyanin
MRPNKRWIPAAALLLVSVACAGEQAPTGGGEAGQTVAVEMTDFAFQPTALDGEAGQTVTVTLHNEGQAEHTFTVESQDVDVVVEPGGSGEAQVTLDGSPFLCRFHAGQGMTGTLGAATGAQPTADTGGTTDDTGSGGGYDPYG